MLINSFYMIILKLINIEFPKMIVADRLNGVGKLCMYFNNIVYLKCAVKFLGLFLL